MQFHRLQLDDVVSGSLASVFTDSHQSNKELTYGLEYHYLNGVLTPVLATF